MCTEQALSAEGIMNEASVTPVENATRSPSIRYISFRTVNFPTFSRIPFPSCMLLNDAPKPTFSAISQEKHPQIVNRKLSPLHNIVAYLLKTRTVEAEKQPLLGNARKQ
jgi:hypothetical protein